MNGPQLERLLTVAASPKARLIAVGGRRDLRDAPEALRGSATSSIHVFQLGKSAKPTFEAKLSDVAVQALCFASDNLLIAGLDDGRVLSFDPSSGSGEAKSEWKADAAINALVAVGDGRVAAADHDGSLHLLAAPSAAGLSHEASRKVTDGSLGAVAVDPTGSFVITGGGDGVARAVPTKSFAKGELREMPVGSETITALSCTDDARVVAGLADGSVLLCFLEGAVDVEDRSAGAPHDTAVRGLLVIPEQSDDKGRPLPRRLVSLSEDGALKTWELDSRRRPKTVGAPALATAMALAPATKSANEQAKAGTVAIVSDSRKLSLWNLDRDAQATPWLTVESRFAQLGQDLRARADAARETAIGELGRLPENDAREQLERALASDKLPRLRALVAKVLGEGMRRLSRPALHTALDDSHPDARKAAFAALRRIDEAAPLSPVRAALGSKHWDIRKEAVESLPKLRAASPLVPGLVAGALTDSEAKVRVAAFEALFGLADEGSLTPVVTSMRHGPEDVRVMALLRLAARGALEGDGRDILERALDDESEQARRMALNVAIHARAALAGRLSSFDARIRKDLAKVAGRAGVALIEDEGTELSDEDKQPLFAALAARSPDSALRGARALGLLADRRASGALLSLSREPDPSLRRAVVEAIEVAAYAMPHDTRLFARLEWLLDDPDEHVRAAAFDALARIQKPDGAAGELGLASLALRCKSPDVRVRALPLLTKFGGGGQWSTLSELPARADDLLGDALDDEGDKVRAEAFRTLWAWHAKAPQEPLTRAARSRHPDIRKRAATELGRIKEEWADALLLELAGDTASSVGRAAFDTFVDKSKAHEKDARIYVAILASPRPDIRALGCKKTPPKVKGEALPVIVKLVSDDQPIVHTAAIEAVDRLKPDDVTAFQQAFASVFYALRVRAGELCGKRRDERAIEPMEKLLSIPKEELAYPSEELRRRAARALADVGAPKTLDFLTALLEEEDGFVAEQGARGLATASRPGNERALVDAMSHDNLAVRSWAAEGLARLGDVRAVPVLAGSLAHEHRPIRLGAIMGYVALGADGVRGILAGLDDADREIADLCFAVVVARDLALRRADLPPDLLLSVLGSSQPEIRFAAARLLEARGDADAMRKVAIGLVGPPIPERASEMKEWPEEDQRAALVNVVVDALSSDHPAQRYAATQVLALRKKPKAFWREAGRMQGPQLSADLRIPHTNWEAEKLQPQKKGWIRALFARSERAAAEPGTGRVLEVLSFVGGKRARAVPTPEGAFAEHRRLSFGTYVGLVRQAPAEGEADVTHRVRRDSIARLLDLAARDDVGRDVVLPVLRQSLNDPNHLVRRAAIAALRGTYEAGAIEPLSLMLKASAADVGKAAVDALLEAAQSGDESADMLLRSAIDAPVADVRKHALTVLPRRFESGSAEPFILALSSTYADVRLAVVDRLVDSTDQRVNEALTRAMESTHEDLRLKAASALAHRGDDRTVDVLAGLLRSERAPIVSRALEALVALSHARPEADGNDAVAAKAAGAVTQRIADDPDRTADRKTLIAAVGRIASPEAAPALLELTLDDDAATRDSAASALITIALDRQQLPQRLRDGRTRRRYREAELLGWLEPLATSAHENLRKRVATVLRDVDDRGAEELLARLLGDRSEEVRTTACETLAFRVEHVEDARLDSLAATLRGGRREMVLPAAIGLATRQRPEAFQALLLALKAGLQPERQRAVLGLGSLGDARALDELRIFIDPTAELEPDDLALAPVVARAYGRLVRHLPEDATEARDEVRSGVERLATETVGPVRFAALTGLREAGDERSRAILENTAADALEAHDLRRHAIAELAILGDESSEGVLAALLSDQYIRGDALAALERLFPTDRTRTSLHALASNDASIQSRGAAYLTKHGDAETLVKSLASIEDSSVRGTLRRGLVRRGACPIAALEALLGTSDAGPRADAAWIAGASPSEGKGLSDAVTRALSETLRARTDKKGDPVELDAALRATLFAASALGANATEDARAVLSARGIDPAARREALRHLARVDDAADRARLEAAAFDLDPESRVIAGESLAESKEGRALFEAGLVDGAAITPVVAAIRATDEGALYESARRRQLSLPTVFRAGEAPALIALAKTSGKDDKRLAAIAALGRLGGDAATDTLSGIAQDDSDEGDVRAAAFRSLRRLQRRAERLEKGHAS